MSKVNDPNTMFFDIKLLKSIIDSLDKYVEISDDLCRVFSYTMTKAIKHASNQPISNRLIPDEYRQLSELVASYWHSMGFKHQDKSEFAFQMGQIYTYTSILNTLLDEHTKKSDEEKITRHWKEYLNFYSAIADEPGISHQALADILGKKKAALSIFVAKNRCYGLFYEVFEGRVKSYYLTIKGKEFLTRFQHESEKEENAEKPNSSPNRIETHALKKVKWITSFSYYSDEEEERYRSKAKELEGGRMKEEIQKQTLSMISEFDCQEATDRRNHMKGDLYVTKNS